jgi:hypothetical protein
MTFWLIKLTTSLNKIKSAFFWFSKLYFSKCGMIKLIILVNFVTRELKLFFVLSWYIRPTPPKNSCSCKSNDKSRWFNSIVNLARISQTEFSFCLLKILRLKQPSPSISPVTN